MTDPIPPILPGDRKIAPAYAVPERQPPLERRELDEDEERERRRRRRAAARRPPPVAEADADGHIDVEA